MDDTTTRRRVLGLAGSVALVSLAGCTTGNSRTGQSTPTPDESGAASPTATPASDHHGGTEHHDEATGHGDDGHDEGTEQHGNDGHDEATDHGDGHEHTHAAAPEGPAPSATVEMVSTGDGEHFDPHVAWVEAGGTVTFVNESGAHSATAYHPDNDRPLRQPEAAEAWDSGLLTASGAAFEVTFDVPGVYDYYCAPHESLGMLGTVIVGEPDPHDQPGLEAPQSGLPEGARKTVETLNERANGALGHAH